MMVVLLAVLQYGAVPYIIFLTYKAYREAARCSGIETDGCQTCLMSTFCRPCVTAQLARHTADHATYPYNMCNERGLPVYAPVVV